MRNILGCGLFVVLAAAAQTPQQLFEQGLVKERSEGKLQEAIGLYQKAAAAAGKNRTLAAKALVEAGQCYQKLGDAESRKLFERVIKEYGDQTDSVALARAALGSGAAPGRQTNTLLWKHPGGYTSGAVSAGGRYASYEDNGNLVVRDIAAGTERRITDKTANTKDHVDGSAFSPDGRRIAYAWHTDNNARYEVWIATVTGDSAAHRLSDGRTGDEVEPHDWTPDGKSLVVQVYLKSGGAQIALMSANDGKIQVVKHIDGRGAERIFCSPDGKYLAYDSPVTPGGERMDLFVTSLDGRNESEEPLHTGLDKVMGWTPDGSRLLFVRGLAAAHGLWAYRVADGKFAGTPELLRADIGHAESFGVTRAGALYYGVTRNTNSYDFWNVHVANIDFESGKLDPVGTELASIEHGVVPRWSPDGKLLAYSWIGQGTSANERSVIIRSTETGRIVRVLPTKLTGTSIAAWSPDGRSLAGVAFDGSAGWKAILMDADTGDVSTLFTNTAGGMVSDPVYAPDGKSLYFVRDQRASGGKAEVIRRDLSSGREETLARGEWFTTPHLSPDGRYAAMPAVDVASNSRTILLIPIGGGATRELMRVHFDGAPGQLTNSQQMLRSGPVLMPVMWMPDSRSLIINKRLTDESQPDEVWNVPVDGSDARKLALRFDRRIAPGSFSLHPNGRIVAYGMNETGAWQTPSTEVWVVEGFLPAAK